MNLEHKDFVKVFKEIRFEQGMIEAWKHIQNICNLCIKAHKEEIKKLRSRKKI